MLGVSKICSNLGSGVCLGQNKTPLKPSPCGVLNSCEFLCWFDVVFAKRFATATCHSALGLAEQLAQALAHYVINPGPIFLLAGLTAKQYCSSCTPVWGNLGYRLSYLQVLDNLVSLGAYNHLETAWVANLRVQDFCVLCFGFNFKFCTIKTL